MTDTTYVTTLDDWILGEDAKEMRSLLEGQSKYDLIGDERIALTRIHGHPLFVHEFELEAPLPPPGTKGVIRENETFTLPAKGRFDRQKHCSLFGREYRFLDKKLIMLVGDNERCYTIQNLGDGKVLIQWATHHHDEEKERILIESEHALWRKDMGPLLPYAFILGEKVLALGDCTKAITGFYRELNRKD